MLSQSKCKNIISIFISRNKLGKKHPCAGAKVWDWDFGDVASS